MSTDQSTLTIYTSPFGPLNIVTGLNGIEFIGFDAAPPAQSPRDGSPDAVTAACLEQLHEYFAGDRRTFDLSLDLKGTDLQLAVWQELVRIPYGRTATYGEVARRIDPSLFPNEPSRISTRGSSVRPTEATRSRSSSPATG